MGKKVLIAGASGMIGSIILERSLGSPEVDQVISLVRKPKGLKHEKLQEVAVPDFGDLSSYSRELHNVDAAFFCIGVYTGSVPDDQFKVITVDYAKAFANALLAHSPKARLCFLSGAGADREGKSRMTFARYKGMAETYISNLGLADVHFFRPGYIYPVVKRKEPNTMYRIMRFLYPVLKPLLRSSSIRSTELAGAMLKIGLEGGELEIYENKDILDVVRD